MPQKKAKPTKSKEPNRSNPSDQQTAALLETALQKTLDHYLTREKVYRVLLDPDPHSTDVLAEIDAIYQHIRTSLQFRQYRRATWYYGVLYCLCQKVFPEG